MSSIPISTKCHTPYAPTNFYLKEKSNLQFKWKKPKSHHTSWAFHILKTPNFEWSRKQNKEKLKTATNQEILSFEIWYRNIISFYISVRWALSQVLKKPLKINFSINYQPMIRRLIILLLIVGCDLLQEEDTCSLLAYCWEAVCFYM